MLNFAKSEKIIGLHDLEAKSMTFKAVDLKVKRISMFNFHCLSIYIHIYTFNTEIYEFKLKFRGFIRQKKKKYFLYL